jgi:hypothetical protein
MTTDEENFENNLMPKLLADYKDAKQKGETQYCFDEKRVIEYSRSQGGLSTRAWEGEDLRKNLTNLVKKGLIEKVGDDKYCLTELGNQWKEKNIQDRTDKGS